MEAIIALGWGIVKGRSEQTSEVRRILMRDLGGLGSEV